LDGRRLVEDNMKALASRLIAVGIALLLVVAPVLAQDAPDTSATGQSQQAQAQDQGQNPSADNTDSATPVSTATPGPADAAAVIAQWGTAQSIGPDADTAVAERWFRDQNAVRARWGVPTAMRDSYLNWQAENILRSQLGEPQLPQPQGVTKPAVAAQSAQTDQAVLSEPEFWTVSDDLWQARLDGIQGHPSEFWQEDHPGEQWFTIDRYIRLFKLQQMPRFDRYRLIGVSGRVDTSGSAGAAIPAGEADALETIAPGAMAAYNPLSYPDNVVAVVGYDPWLNADGSMRL
jgi:hypothetical protein